MVREEIRHLHIPNLLCSERIQVVGCEIRESHNLSLFCVYRSPQSTETDDSELLDCLKSAVRGKQRWVIMGDFNAPGVDWLRGTARGQRSFEQRLLDTVHDWAAFQHVKEPTRFGSGHIPSTLDLVITPFESDVEGIRTSNPLGRSDHVVIHATVNVSLRQPPPKLVQQYWKADPVRVTSQANQLCWHDDHGLPSWEIVKGNLLKISEEQVPTVRATRHKSCPWFKGEAKRLAHLKAKSWRRMKGNPTHINFRKYKEVRNKAVSILRLSRAQYETQLARSVTLRPKRFYSYVQSRVRLRQNVSRAIRSGLDVLESDEQIAEAFKRFFCSVYRGDNGLPVPPTNYRIPVGGMQDSPILEAETMRELRAMRPDKSPGPDGIHPTLIKMAADALISPFTKMFNSLLAKGEVPTDWKHAHIVPLHKKGDRGAVSNYRPVSLTSVPCKVFERILRRRICEYLTQNDLISPEQHGFLKGKSCLSNLLLCLDEITQALDSGNQVDIGYLDFQKAFDSVNLRFLVAKLAAYGIAPQICKWVEAFLTGRTMEVRVRGEASTIGYPTSGVPQGTVLGPLLFLIYVNDLTIGLQSSCFLFADDIKVLSTQGTTNVLQEDLGRIAQWSSMWDLPLNVEKCQHLSSTDNPSQDLTLPSGPLTKVDRVRDLGVTIDRSFTPSAQCADAAQRARKALFLLRGAIANRTKEVWVALYCALVRPHLEYCIQAWSPYLKRDIDLLEKVQRLATRWVTGMKGIPYEERLKRLNLFSLKRRRMRGDLIEVYLMANEKAGLPMGKIIHWRDGRVVRGNGRPLQKTGCRTERRKGFYSLRVVNPWNKLPNEVVTASSLESFKRRLDQCWETIFPLTV